MADDNLAQLATPDQLPKPSGFDRAMGFYEKLRVNWRNWWNRETANAYKTLAKAMKDDPQYAASWQANIAMPMFDAAKGKLTHQEANDIADILMRHLFDVHK